MDCGFCAKIQRRDNMRRHVRLHVKHVSEILNTQQIEFCLANKTPLIVNQKMIACMICGKFEITANAINQFKRQYQINHCECVKSFDSVKKYYCVPTNALVDAFPDIDYETKRTEIVKEIQHVKQSIVDPPSPTPAIVDDTCSVELEKLKEKYKELEQDWEDSMDLATTRKKQLDIYKEIAYTMVDVLTQCRNEITKTVGDASSLLNSIDKALETYDELD
jgi:hypothetical protein